MKCTGSCNALVRVGDHMECLDCRTSYPVVEPVKIKKVRTKKIVCTHQGATRLNPNDPSDGRRYCRSCKTIIHQ